MALASNCEETMVDYWPSLAYSTAIVMTMTYVQYSLGDHLAVVRLHRSVRPTEQKINGIPNTSVITKHTNNVASSICDTKNVLVLQSTVLSVLRRQCIMYILSRQCTDIA